MKSSHVVQNDGLTCVTESPRCTVCSPGAGVVLSAAVTLYPHAGQIPPLQVWHLHFFFPLSYLVVVHFGNKLIPVHSDIQSRKGSPHNIFRSCLHRILSSLSLSCVSVILSDGCFCLILLAVHQGRCFLFFSTISVRFCTFSVLWPVHLKHYIWSMSVKFPPVSRCLQNIPYFTFRFSRVVQWFSLYTGQSQDECDGSRDD